MRILLLLLVAVAVGLELAPSAAILRKHKLHDTRSMTDREAYDQLVRFFAMNRNPPPGSLQEMLVHAVSISPMWLELDAQFGDHKKAPHGIASKATTTPKQTYQASPDAQRAKVVKRMGKRVAKIPIKK